MEEHSLPLEMENISAELLPPMSQLIFAAKINIDVRNT
jgi:hypothetical protein